MTDRDGLERAILRVEAAQVVCGTAFVTKVRKIGETSKADFEPKAKAKPKADTTPSRCIRLAITCRHVIEAAIRESSGLSQDAAVGRDSPVAITLISITGAGASHTVRTRLDKCSSATVDLAWFELDSAFSNQLAYLDIAPEDQVTGDTVEVTTIGFPASMVDAQWEDRERRESSSTTIKITGTNEHGVVNADRGDNVASGYSGAPLVRKRKALGVIEKVAKGDGIGGQKAKVYAVAPSRIREELKRAGYELPTPPIAVFVAGGLIAAVVGAAVFAELVGGPEKQRDPAPAGKPTHIPATDNASFAPVGTASGRARARFSGWVHDRDRPLVGAKVEVGGADCHGFTDSHGQFDFTCEAGHALESPKGQVTLSGGERCAAYFGFLVRGTEVSVTSDMQCIATPSPPPKRTSCHCRRFDTTVCFLRTCNGIKPASIGECGERVNDCN